jgi:Domain of unknown function (DUF1707)
MCHSRHRYRGDRRAATVAWRDAGDRAERDAGDRAERDAGDRAEHTAGERADRAERAAGDRAEPFIPEPHDLRASDAERERVVEALRAHAAAGRLSTDELEQRLDRALAAERRSDLVALLGDLPARPRPIVAVPHVRRGKDPRTLLAVAVLLVAIWAVTGAGYFWPVWPLMWFAFAGLRHHRPRSNTRVISNILRTE